MIRLLIAFCALLLAGCGPGCKSVESPTAPPASSTRRHLDITITFVREPTIETAVLLRAAGAVQTTSPKVWTLDNYDFESVAQGDAVHAALAEGAKMGPRR